MHFYLDYFYLFLYLLNEPIIWIHSFFFVYSFKKLLKLRKIIFNLDFFLYSSKTNKKITESILGDKIFIFRKHKNWFDFGLSSFRARSKMQKIKKYKIVIWGVSKRLLVCRNSPHKFLLINGTTVPHFNFLAQTVRWLEIA